MRFGYDPPFMPEPIPGYVVRKEPVGIGLYLDFYPHADSLLSHAWIRYGEIGGVKMLTKIKVKVMRQKEIDVDSFEEAVAYVRAMLLLGMHEESK